MKKLLMSVLFVMSGMAFAMDRLPQGKYTGGGGWNATDKDYGSFDSLTKITKNRIEVTYKWDGKVRDHAVYVIRPMSRRGFFHVDSTYGDELGQGYCVVNQCHFSVERDGKRIEETMTFSDDSDTLTVIGSTTTDAKVELWHEKLHRKGYED